MNAVHVRAEFESAPVVRSLAPVVRELSTHPPAVCESEGSALRPHPVLVAHVIEAERRSISARARLAITGRTRPRFVARQPVGPGARLTASYPLEAPARRRRLSAAPGPVATFPRQLVLPHTPSRPDRLAPLHETAHRTAGSSLRPGEHRSTKRTARIPITSSPSSTTHRHPPLGTAPERRARGQGVEPARRGRTASRRRRQGRATSRGWPRAGAAASMSSLVGAAAISR